MIGRVLFAIRGSFIKSSNHRPVKPHSCPPAMMCCSMRSARNRASAQPQGPRHVQKMKKYFNYIAIGIEPAHGDFSTHPPRATASELFAVCEGIWIRPPHAPGALRSQFEILRRPGRRTSLTFPAKLRHLQSRQGRLAAPANTPAFRRRSIRNPTRTLRRSATMAQQPPVIPPNQQTCHPKHPPNTGHNTGINERLNACRKST